MCYSDTMKTVLKNIGLGVLFLTMIFTSRSLIAQPTSWDLDITEFEYSASFTWQVTYASSLSVEEGDYMAAFVGDEVRGVVSALHNPNLDQYFFLLLVYSNVPTGENVNFKFYDASEDKIDEIDQVFTFVADQSSGSFSNPLSVVIESITAVEDKVLQEISIYPIPFTDSFNISLPENNLGNYTLIIRNLVGKKLLKKELIPQQFTYEVNALSSASKGIYIVQIEFNGAVRNYRVTKK